MTDPTLDTVDRSVWWGWGDPARAGSLPAAARRHLRDRLDVPERRTPPVPLTQVRMAPDRLTEAARAALVQSVGAQQVLGDPRTRMEHAGGKGYVDLARARGGDGSYAPDAVVLPADATDLAAVLAAAREHDFVVVPFGGGTSVVGGLSVEPGEQRARVSLDLRLMSGLVDLDETDLVATFGAGTRAIDAERALRDRGYTLGHFPQSYQEATIGGFVATRSAGQSSSGYGRIDDMVTGVRVTTPVGPAEFGSRSPASAAGPRLLDVVVGSEGAFGIITEATLRVQRAPTVTRHAAVAFGSFDAATAALRDLIQQLGHDAQPDVTRVSDPDETQISLLLAGRAGAALGRYLAVRGMPQPCLAIFLWHDRSDKQAAERERRARRIFNVHGGIRLPRRIAQGWEHGRFNAPYLRDELMTMGVFVETLETATTWHNLDNVYSTVRDAIGSALQATGTPGVVQCHISHVYHSGASLYFTYLARAADDPIAQWQAVKSAASEAIITSGGTITHHHAVGRDHRRYLADEIGEVGVTILDAVKHALDPANVLNPGVLVPKERR